MTAASPLSLGVAACRQLLTNLDDHHPLALDVPFGPYEYSAAYRRSDCTARVQLVPTQHAVNVFAETFDTEHGFRPVGAITQVRYPDGGDITSNAYLDRLRSAVQQAAARIGAAIDPNVEVA